MCGWLADLVCQSQHVDWDVYHKRPGARSASDHCNWVDGSGSWALGGGGSQIPPAHEQLRVSKLAVKIAALSVLIALCSTSVGFSDVGELKLAPHCINHTFSYNDGGLSNFKLLTHLQAEPSAGYFPRVWETGHPPWIGRTEQDCFDQQQSRQHCPVPNSHNEYCRHLCRLDRHMNNGNATPQESEQQPIRKGALRRAIRLLPLRGHVHYRGQ